MKKERQTIATARLLNNEGQVEWLPGNPRTWTGRDLERTRKSLANDPDFLEDRPLLAVPHGRGFVVFAGNLRLAAAKELRLEAVPVVAYTPESEGDRLTVKRRAMLDNGSFGSWDMDALANEWSDLPLPDWGVPAWDTSEADEGFAKGAGDGEDDGYDVDAAAGITVRCSPGDVWRLGDHRLMCGDSIELEQVKKLMGGGKG